VGGCFVYYDLQVGKKKERWKEMEGVWDMAGLTNVRKVGR
jgi:hypothetical protein